AHRRYRWPDLLAVHRFDRRRDHRSHGGQADPSDRRGRRPARGDRQDPRLGRPWPVGARHPRHHPGHGRGGWGRCHELVTRPVTTDAPPGTRWSRAVVVAAFLAVHGFYTWMAVADPGVGFGDVGLYQYWAWDGLENGVWPLRDFPWVYPALALVPVTLPGFVSTLEWEPYTAAWMALVTALNAVATVALARRATLGALWWIAFLAFLGPVAFGRIDAIVVPLAICGLVFSATRPRVAAVLLTVGAWIKVAPG